MVCCCVALVTAFGCDQGPQVDVRGEGPSARTAALSRVEADIEQRYPNIGHISLADFDERRAKPTPLLLIDARTKAEFDVSHIENAIRVDPDASVSQLDAKLGTAAHGAEVVFYCSVGERSSRLATKANAMLRERGATAVSSLRGGIFAWHNDGRALRDWKGQTRHLHPYNDKWGQLLVHRDLMTTQPRH